MLNTLLKMYLTILPLSLSGIINMLFTKTQFYKRHNRPIDNHRNWKDGKRIFGDNKTWIGFISMIVISIIIHVIVGACIDMLHINHMSELYLLCDNTVLYNLIFGLLAGFLYMIAELPNSFIKRRLDIASGKTDKGIKGVIFFIIDQIDSLVGIAFLFCIIAKISVWKAVQYIILGAITHIGINLVLYALKIRKNI